jgi:hypothetical protein
VACLEEDTSRLSIKGFAVPSLASIDPDKLIYKVLQALVGPRTTLAAIPRPDKRQAMDRLLRCTTSKVTDVENRFLEEAPSLLEIGEIVGMLHNDKLPGSDGLTSEVFKTCWHFIKQDFLQMVLEF